MINNYKDYRRYISQDAKAMGIDPESRLELLRSYLLIPQWKFIRRLRRLELHKNSKGLIHKLLYLYYWYQHKRYGLKLGFSIPPNVCREGLSLPHYGTIVINNQTQIGSNCRIHVCVNIGASNGGAPVIGDNVYIGPGVKIFGDITIGNNVKIGANAVVNSSFNEDDIILAGMPAKIVKRIDPMME